VLPEIFSSPGVGLVLVATLALIVKLILGVIVTIRARKKDLPKIVRGLSGWFFRRWR
jgi:hypothetical protein